MSSNKGKRPGKATDQTAEVKPEVDGVAEAAEDVEEPQEKETGADRSAKAYHSLHAPSNYHEYMRAQKFRGDGGSNRYR